ncbi:tetratricopeptide repeat protein (plasmid) [Bacillus thuringiensis]|uniref:Tetratricopeptide repeat family protein n=1 Tax=Bacillus thuringiensis TaxID=1428 RepID=A0A0B5NHZ1_BACTU|nr:tetratricopeptide repeat protein [Bacillus thuringiensis]AJG73631.1 tetratricopeptide repeat family protein [Bacillus thuringiensis]EEM74726.1 tetratricopeptide TPR_4 containing protein [Bacillus thuringiensis serovar pondicheriensis BGSC 4BA1]QKH22477.1 tetratricopeptide repeat protein [Bacillus thuringiensis]
MSRNQPCPCGSGKKYKKCCLQKVSNPNRFAASFSSGGRVFARSVEPLQKPNDYVSLLDLGIFYKRRGLYEQAKEQCIKAIRVNPKHFQAYYNLGKVLYILGEYNQAVKSYKTALELGYDRVGDVMRHMGHALLDEKQSESEKHIVMHYLQSIDPFKKLAHKKPTNKEIDDYDAKCVVAARRYVELELADE